MSEQLCDRDYFSMVKPFSTGWEFYCDACGERLDGVSYEAAKRAYDTHMDAAMSSKRGPAIPDCQTCREHAELDLPTPCLACALDGRREEYEEMERDRRAEL